MIMKGSSLRVSILRLKTSSSKITNIIWQALSKTVLALPKVQSFWILIQDLRHFHTIKARSL